MRGVNELNGIQSNKGTRTSRVFEALVDEHGMGVVCSHSINYDEARFSEGFLYAVKKGMLPILGSEEPVPPSRPGAHYHHLIIDGEVWVAYFPEEEE